MSSELVRSFHGQAYKRASQHFPNVSLHFILATARISIAGSLVYCTFNIAHQFALRRKHV